MRQAHVTSSLVQSSAMDLGMMNLFLLLEREVSSWIRAMTMVRFKAGRVSGTEGSGIEIRSDSGSESWVLISLSLGRTSSVRRPARCWEGENEGREAISSIFTPSTSAFPQHRKIRML